VVQLSVLKHAAKDQYYNYVVQNAAEEGFLRRIFGLKGCKKLQAEQNSKVNVRVCACVRDMSSGRNRCFMRKASSA
jgi:hypothetical protein